jgi:hypothetical protein
MIFSLFKRLIDLDFCFLSTERMLSASIFDAPSIRQMSPALARLKINVELFNDCLYLLDGRFACLSTLFIHVNKFSCISSETDNTVSTISIIMLYKKP